MARGSRTGLREMQLLSTKVRKKAETGTTTRSDAPSLDRAFLTGCERKEAWALWSPGGRRYQRGKQRAPSPAVRSSVALTVVPLLSIQRSPTARVTREEEESSNQRKQPDGQEAENYLRTPYFVFVGIHLNAILVDYLFYPCPW